jgi:alpha-N-arabinofuranosidase
MRRKTFAHSVIVTACCLVSTGAYSQTSPAVLTIQVDKPVSKVSPMLYGLMTEEINYSYDGGLYAEMVRNRTFRANRSNVPNWFLVEDGAAQAKMGVDESTGPSEALPHSLRLDVANADTSSPAGVLNEGYWGMPLRPNTVYQGSFYAKEDSAAVGPVTIGY